jgi:hypothetical protein
MESESQPPGGQSPENQPSNTPQPTPPPYPLPPQGQQPYGQQPYGQHPYGQMPYGQQPYGQPGYPPPTYPQGGPYAPPRGRDNKTIAIILGACGCAGFLGLVILGAILLPVFSQARKKALDATCISHMKQQSLGILMYSMDYDERMPPANQWMDLAAPYIKRDEVFHCPVLVKENPTGFGYAFETRLSALPMERVESANMTPMIFDSTLLSGNATDSGSSLAISPVRHRNATGPCAYVSFADGHTTFVTAYPPFPPLLEKR